MIDERQLPSVFLSYRWNLYLTMIRFKLVRITL